MAKAEEQSTAQQLYTLEYLKETNKISDAIYYGVKAQNGWKTGKNLSETDFLKAVESFKSSGIKGR